LVAEYCARSGSGARAEAEAAAGLLALATPGFSGAELASVVSEAGLLARRAGQECIGLAELLEGARRTRFGVSGAGG
jgi:cell division protease FtsH